MATQAQIDANRRNSEKSTGPVSAEGKAASCMNALKSGVYAESVIIRGESVENLDALAAQFQQDYDPQTAGEQTLVDSLVAAAWFLRRFVQVEAHMWERQFVRLDKVNPKTFLADAYTNSTTNFYRHQRRQDSVAREFRATLKDLMRVQAERRKAEPDPAPAPAPETQPSDPEPVTPEIGFVPSNQPTPDAPRPEPQTDPQRPAAAASRPVHKLVRSGGHIAVTASGLSWKRRKSRAREKVS